MAEAGTDRLRFSYHLNRGLTSISDLGELVKFATQRARELFEAEGAALIMLDEEAKELYFPVVSDVDRWAQVRVGRLRFPVGQGIAGWVLQNDQATIVSDADADDRFYSEIDKQTHLKTRSMLCAPLRSARGNIGVIEIVNPADRYLTEDDLQFLDHIAADIAMACERARMVDDLRSQVAAKQRALRLTGIGLLASGIVLLLVGAMAGATSSALVGAGLSAAGAFVTLGHRDSDPASPMAPKIA